MTPKESQLRPAGLGFLFDSTPNDSVEASPCDRTSGSRSEASRCGRIPCATFGVLLAAVFALSASAQTGTISGLVTHQSTGDFLADAQVVIPGTTLADVTDSTGAFTIVGVPAGAYDVRASLAGFGDVTTAGVDVTAASNTTVSFQLALVPPGPMRPFAEHPANRFTTPQAAAAQATEAFRGLLEIQNTYGIDFGVDADSLKRAVPGNLIRSSTAEIDSLLSSSPTLVPHTSSRERYVVPLEVAGRTLATVELVTEPPYWAIARVGASRVAYLLNRVRNVVGPVGVVSLSYIEVPNIGAEILIVETSAGSRFFTDYPPFTLDVEVSEALLLNQLHSDAQDFQNQFGRLIQYYGGRVF